MRIINGKIGICAGTLFLVALLLLISPQISRSQSFQEPTLAEYTANPIILSASSTPNIMIIIDNSGSMNESAYGTDSYSGSGNVWEATTSSGQDWAHEIEMTGRNYSGSSVLDLGRIQDLNRDTIVGIRWQNVNIPQGANITNAYIEFTAAETDNQTTRLTIYGHKTPSSPEFTSGTYGHYDSDDNYDLSGRTHTDTSVSWQPEAWQGPWYNYWFSTYRTGDLSSIVQEIVDQDQWNDGNALSFLIENQYSGNGGRVALANVSGSGPRLHIEYETTSRVYYGYFDSNARYSYNNGYRTSDKYFYQDPNGDWSGNWLNWLTMRKIDVARKVIVGGRAQSRLVIDEDDDEPDVSDVSTILVGETVTGRSFTKYYNCSSCNETPYGGNYSYYCDNGNFTVNRTSYRIAVKKEEAREPDEFVNHNVAGVMQRVGNNARWGNMWFYSGTGSGNEGGFVANPVGSAVDTLVANIEDYPAKTWTPLAETMYVAMQYFKQEQTASGLGYSRYAVGTLNDDNDPFYDNGSKIDCAKSYLILITDGASTKDTQVPSGYRDYDNDGDRSCYNDGNCTYSDGGSDYLDDIALYAHTVDLRQGYSNYLDGKQTLTLYPIYAFGNDENARQLLKDAAKNGGFTDLNGNNRPDDPEEYDTDGDGVPDTYFEASDGYYLENKLMAAIVDILQDTSSGSAVSVLATSSEGQGTLTQAYFQPRVSNTTGSSSTEVKWVGHLHALWVDENGNMRENTVSEPDHPALVSSQDKVVQFYYDDQNGEAKLRRIEVDEYGDPMFDDANGNGEKDDDENYVSTSCSMDELVPIWDAGKRLSVRAPDSRDIRTWVDLDQDMVVDNGEFLSFEESNVSAIGPFFGVKDDDTWSYLGPTVPFRRFNLLSFIKGHDTGFQGTTRIRSRSLGGGVWKLGDIIESTPVTVGAPSENYGLIYSDSSYNQFLKNNKDREQVVYVGANDGMLHAFYMGQYHEGDNPVTSDVKEDVYFSKASGTTANFGDELWAYIPQALLPHLKWLADPKYDHSYYVDLQPRILDAKIIDGDDGTEEWGTILIGGLNLGGKKIRVRDDFPEGDDSIRTFSSSYFAINITDPHNPKLLWERTYENLGLTVNRPTVGKVGDKWCLLVGSGPTDYDGESDQNAHIYVLDLKTGNILRDFRIDEPLSSMAGAVTVDCGLNYNIDVAYFGMSRSTTNDGRKGGIYRVYVPKVEADDWRSPDWDSTYMQNPEDWDIHSMLSTDAPVTAPSAVSTDSKGNLWVYLGTGRYIEPNDKTDQSTQYFFGVKDPVFNSELYDTQETAFAKTLTSSDLLNTSGISVYTDKSVTGIGGVSNWSQLLRTVRGKDGWYFQLGQELENAGERVLNKPTVLGGMVYDTSFVPNPDLCGYSGTSNLLGFYYLSGTAYIRESFKGGSEQVTVEGETKTRLSIKLDLGTGQASGVAVHVGSGKGATGYVQQSTGIISDIELTPPMNTKSGLIFWRER